MLKYFVMTAEALIVAAILTGAMRGFLTLVCGKLGKISSLVGTAVGLVLAGVMSYMKNNTSLVDTSLWNLRIYQTAILAFIFALVAGILKVTLLKKWKASKLAGDIVLCVSVSYLIAMALFYAFPDVMGYPHTILLVDSNWLSTDFLFKIIGIIFGLVLVCLIQMGVHRGMLRMPKAGAYILTLCLLAVNTARQFTAAIGVLFAKNMLTDLINDIAETTGKQMMDVRHEFFEIAIFSTNKMEVFLYSTIALALVIPVALWIKSFVIKLPYSNPAEKRKIRKGWRVTRRWANLIVITLVASIFTVTTVKVYANKEPSLSPVEDAEIADGNVIVPFEAVEDGHLHRFAYYTDSGKEIRFIVIKKPNSTSYGIGLDACDICGETGYFERDGQVVCKLCNVVMNINTIGFKGGCNPIVIPYTVNDGRILVPIDGLMEYESKFKGKKI
ncbi:MAG: DUF2318 domain-containing protein [Ruminococcus sp.]|nr:DUF2318 domain-containing protein [Ruminococcus sp.]